MYLFDNYNTEGYSEDQLSEFNAEWKKRCKELKLQPESDDYHQAAKNFADEVSRRYPTSPPRPRCGVKLTMN